MSSAVIIVAVVFSLWASPAFAQTTHNAASCSYNDVNAKRALAVDGDTISIPSGTCAWHTPATVTAITTTGNPTTITAAGHNFVAGDSVCFISITTSPTNLAAACRTVASVVDVDNFTVAQNVTGASDQSGTVHQNTMTFTAGITLQGAGCPQDGDERAIEPCLTVLQDDMPNTGLSMISHTLVDGAHFRVTGIHFDEGTRSSVSITGVLQLVGRSTGDRRVRVDHNVFTVRGHVFAADTLIGVVDHNTITRLTTAGASIGSIKGSFWASDTDIDGDGAWAEGCTDFGQEKQLFFENNTIQYQTTNAHATMIDSQAGGRYVMRYNDFIRGSTESHGTESGGRERSGCSFEIYGNTFTGANTSANTNYFRGANGIIWGNSATNYAVSSAYLNLLYNRATDPYAPFGGADGRNPVDVNDPGGPFMSGTVTSNSDCTVSSGTLCTVSDSGASFPDYTGYVLVRTSGIAVSSLTRSGGTATANLASAHGIATTAVWSINGMTTGLEYNATWTVTATDADSFTFTVPSSFTASPTVGSAIAMPGNWFAPIVSNTGTQITYDDSIQGSNNDMRFVSGTDTYAIYKVTHGMDAPGRDQGSLLTPGNTGVNSLPVGWNDQVTVPWLEFLNDDDGADLDFTCALPVVCGTHALSDIPTGLLAARPASGSGGASDYYWATDQGSWNSGCGDGSDGILYKWNGSSWATHYTPYPCPHPEAGGVEPPADPTAPAGRVRMRRP